jgi:signal transduction histidine kinase
MQLQITYLQNDIGKYKVFADSDMLLSILGNLISNGIKYSHKGGKIAVSAKQRG